MLLSYGNVSSRFRQQKTGWKNKILGQCRSTYRKLRFNGESSCFFVVDAREQVIFERNDGSTPDMHELQGTRESRSAKLPGKPRNVNRVVPDWLDQGKSRVINSAGVHPEAKRTN